MSEVGPAPGRLLGGAMRWGVGRPVALALGVAVAGACCALMTALRPRRHSAR
jgi:hypothetical protein